MQIIPTEIKAIKNSSLDGSVHGEAYNKSKLFYDEQIIQLQIDFEDEQQKLMDEHDERHQNILNKIFAVEGRIFELKNEKLSMEGDLVLWKNISETCKPFVEPLVANGDPSICKITSNWFSDFQLILNEKFVIQRHLDESSDCKSKENWLKSTWRSINKAFRLISEEAEIEKMEISLEEAISELKRIHAKTLLQIKQDNSRALATALKELQILNLKYRNALNELEAIKESNRKLLKNYAVALIECPLYKSAVSINVKYDNGSFIEDIVSATANAHGTFNPNPVINFLKSSAFDNEYCLKVRGLFAIYKLLKLNLHHADALAEVKNLFLIETQRKLTTAEGKCFDLIEFDADILTRSSGHLESSERCHHLHYCNYYEQFLLSTEAVFETPRVDVSCDTSTDVTWFDISENKNVKFLPLNVFRKFPNLKIYYAFKSGVMEIHQNNFFGAGKLQGLWLDHNEIATIESGSFDELQALKWLYLGFNKLTTLDAHIFHKLNLLVSLSLEKNQLTSLPTEIFYTLEELEWIHLNGNPISSQVTDNYFINNDKLTYKFIDKSQNES